MDSEDYSTNAPIPNEGQQSENASVDSATAVESSPLPTRPGHHHSPSTARKRTNEEVYESMRSFKSTLTPSRSQKSTVAASLPNDDVGQATNTLGSHASAPQQDVKPSQLAATNSSAADTSLKDESDLSNSQPSNQSFVTNIDHYQQQLELEFQEFERSLHERNPAEELENMSWDELEARCEEELQPKIALEQEIMDEFSARFEQFMLYMQVSTDHEAERAIKRLRTRIAVTQNSEASLAQKQAHHAKVLEAFQSAMNLLNA